MNNFREVLLKELNCSVNAVVTKFSASHALCSSTANLSVESGEAISIELDSSKWQVFLSSNKEEHKKGVIDLKAKFILAEGFEKEANTGISFTFDEWSEDNYVLMPAAAYNGNRFESRKLQYPPQVCEERDMGPYAEEIITDVPRLNKYKGTSRIQLLTRDLSTPAIGFYAPKKHKGFLLLTEQGTKLGDSGITIVESDDRAKAVITLTAPGVRHDTRYTICDCSFPSEDKGAEFKPKDSVELHARLYIIECGDIHDFFACYAGVRKDITGKSKLYHEIPFYSAWNIQEKKYNEENWIEKYGYYAVGARENKYEDWQIGWVGGIMTTYPLLFEGCELSRERAAKNFDFVFSQGQDVSGFFHGCFSEGIWFGDNFKNTEKKWHLVRKSADALYFIIKQFMLLEELNSGIEVKELWKNGAKKCAEAFVRLWDRYKDFGQFVDSATGELIVYKSASAGIAPAGLALASVYFNNPRYLEVAEEAANHYYESYVNRGITNGGPCEICQCPDSESAFGVLESFIVLYETTLKEHWINKAEHIANQCTTWCVSYDYKFPADSTFGKLGMHSTGAVYANVQNKHGAPGICTLSGDSLFKLYRATGNNLYLELLQDIAHNLPQYLSREDRRIKALDGQCLPAGWMNERVEMSDWWEPIGEVCYSSTWPETSNMLTYVEVPGLYVQTDTGFVCAIDNIEVKVTEKTDNRLVLEIYNPTGFEACVKIFSEKSTDTSKVIGQNSLLKCERLRIDPKAVVKKEFDI
ncbi:MAG: hypothetical protein N2489_09470 [Clostridia bacterium]|nr:hypothetical protein [Clostridia bacterium]